MADARTRPMLLRRWLGLVAVGLALLACALPWHASQVKQTYFAIAPGFRPPVLPTAHVCTGADHWSVLVIAAIALVLQLLLATRWPRQRVLLAAGTLLTGLVATLVVPITTISGHGLFGRIQARSGMLLYLATALFLIVVAIVQIASRKVSLPAADPPAVDPPPAG